MYSVRGFVSGCVQGVGFRWFARRQAEAEGVCGYARNLADGRVEFLLQGEPAAVERVVDALRSGPSHARVGGVELDDAEDLPPRDGFDTR